MKYIFLDIDGVLNNHTQHANGYCGMQSASVEAFNGVLLAYPHAKIVITSAWRYLILNGSMTLRGFESMLLTHGVDCFGRVIGHTEADKTPDEPRIKQIREWLMDHEPPDFSQYVIFDDLPLGKDYGFIQTDGAKGLAGMPIEELTARIAREWKKQLIES